MKRVAILGSTGSIGSNTLRVIAALGNRFKVVGLSAHSNVALLLAQAKKFGPKWICLAEAERAREAKARLPASCRVFIGRDGLADLIQESNADIVVFALAGAEALLPLLQAINMKKTVVLANKEALVIAGHLIMPRVKQNNVKLLPVDSEQSAIWQCLEGRQKSELKKVYLTASGGPFKNRPIQRLKKVSVDKVLRHPRWNMGRRISVDSATMMNKGLEIIESIWLFDLALPQIEVLIHPEAVIHSMVEFIDGIILAQIAVADMRIPIQYALSYPARLKNNLAPLNFFKLEKLHFQRPDTKKFPCLRLAIQAAREGGSLPCVLNAADEVAVDAFLNKRIDFSRIPEIVARVTQGHKKINHPSLAQILSVDAWARAEAKQIIS